jgi:hypothetical protein
MVSGFGGKLRDDFAPPDCRIEYNIQATLNKVNISTSKRETIILKRQKVRIKPAAGDLPLPGLPLDPFDNNQPPRCEVTVNHKGSGLPMGRLSVDLQQPDRFWLPLRDPHSEIIRSARLTLKYIPDNQGRPTSAPTLPIVKSLRGQITATTLYTTTIVQSSSSPPCLFRKKKDLFGRPLNFSDKAIHLPIPSLPKLQWVHNSPSSSPKPAVSATEPRLSEKDQSYYTASLVVPVTLGRDNYLPTFHSCFISRIYSLGLQFDIAQAESAPLKTMKLRVPVEIASKRDPGVLPSYNASLGVVHAVS